MMKVSCHSNFFPILLSIQVDLYGGGGGLLMFSNFPASRTNKSFVLGGFSEQLPQEIPLIHSSGKIFAIQFSN